MGFLGKLRWEKQKLKQRAHYEEELKKAEARKHGHVEPLFQPLQALRGSADAASFWGQMFSRLFWIASTMKLPCAVRRAGRISERPDGSRHISAYKVRHCLSR